MQSGHGSAQSSLLLLLGRRSPSQWHVPLILRPLPLHSVTLHVGPVQPMWHTHAPFASQSPCSHSHGMSHSGP